MQRDEASEQCLGYLAIAGGIPHDSAPGYLIFDRDPSFNEEVMDTVKSFGIRPKRTSFASPWQNGVGERWVGNCRRDLLDHVIVLNERHLKRLLNALRLRPQTAGLHLQLGELYARAAMG